MKKIYAMLGLAMALSLSASAADSQSKAFGNDFSGWKLEKISDVECNFDLSNSPSRVAKKVDTRANFASEGLAGVYYLNWYSFRKEAFTDGGFEVIVNADGKSGIMQGFTSLDNIKIDIDAEKGTISIPPQSFGSGGDWTDSESGKTYKTEVELVHGLWNEDGHGYALVNTPIVIELDENGVYECNWRDIFSIQAKIIDYPEDGVFLTFGADVRGYGLEGRKYPKKLDNTGWIDLGEAQIDNGFIQEGLVQTVKVQQKADEYAVFRLVNPFEGMYTNQIEGVEGELRFDLSCSTAPMIQYGGPIYNGMLIHEVAPDYGWTEENPFSYYMAFSTYASSFYYSQDFETEGAEVFSKEEIGEEFGEDECGSVKDDVVTFAGLVSSISINMSLYNWEDDNDLYQSKFIITMPEGWRSGVEEIKANECAPVKYYNLQGMEVKTPEAGQLVIVNQGSKSYKTIVK